MKQPAEYSSEERKIAFEKTADFLKSSYSQWENTFGPFTELPSDMAAEERDKALGEVDEHLVWFDVLWQDLVHIEPAPGLFLAINGWAMIPARDHFSDEINGHLIGQKPWEGSPYDHEPVFSYLHCGCPFCDGEGELEDGNECDTCEGSGEWEIDA